MEIPVLSRMSGFIEAIIASLKNNSSPDPIVSRILSLFQLGKPSVSPIRYFKWGALVIAFIYTFANISSRIKILILHRYYSKSKPSYASLSDPDDDVSSCASSDDEGEVEASPSCCSSNEDTELDRDSCAAGTNSRGDHGDDEGESGNFHRLRRFSIGESLSDLLTCNGVVKLWNESFYDTDVTPIGENSRVGWILRKLPGAAVMSPAVIVSAVSGSSGKVWVKLWDGRTRRGRPAANAEWGLRWRGAGKVGVGAGGVEKIYVRDEMAEEELVGDARKVESPIWGSTRKKSQAEAGEKSRGFVDRHYDF